MIASVGVDGWHGRPTADPHAGAVAVDGAVDGAADGAADGAVVAIYRTQILPLSETFVRDQALALRRWTPVMVGERQIDALPLSGLRVLARHGGPPTLPQRLAGLAWRRLDRAAPATVRLIRRVRPRLIHAHFGFDGVEAWPIARRLGVPLLVTLHGADITTRMDWFRSGKAGRRWTRYPDRLARLARERRVRFVAVSENIRRAALEAGLPVDRVHVRRIGVDTARFTPGGDPVPQRARRILFLGRLVEKKGCAYLIEALGRVRNELPDAELVVAGDGPDRAALENRARGEPGIRFVGAVTRSEVMALLRQARVFCLPSVTAASGDAEGLPLVLLEAQASGVPVVTSARGGATEGILDGITGYAVPERDVSTLADRLVRILRDDGLAARLSAAAAAFVADRHDLLTQTADLERLYDRVAGVAECPTA